MAHFSCLAFSSPSDLYWTRLSLPDFLRIFRDGAITGELPGSCDVQDGLPRPRLLVGIQFAQPRVRFAVALQVRQVEVVVAMAEKCIDDGREHPGLVLAE